MKTYRYLIYNLCVESDFRLRTPLVEPSPDTPPDLCLTGARSRRLPDLPDSARVYASALTNHFGESAIELYRLGSREVVRFPRAADFELRSGQVVCTLTSAQYQHMLDIWLLGYVLTYYLERRGAVAIHAGAVQIDGSVALMVADAGCGKSTLVAAMVQAGLPLVADDISVLEYDNRGVACRSGYAQIKLTPDQARFFVGGAKGRRRVHPEFAKLSVAAADLGSVACGTFPVQRIYTLNRTAAAEVPASVEPLGSAEALLLLVRHSFLAELVAAAGLGADRLKRLADIVRSVPLKRLTFADGYEHLPLVRDALVADCRGTALR